MSMLSWIIGRNINFSKSAREEAKIKKQVNEAVEYFKFHKIELTANELERYTGISQDVIKNYVDGI